MTAYRKAVVISNCQCLPLAATLTTLSADTVFDFWGVHIIQSSEREAAIGKFLKKALSEYDLILSIPLSEEFGPLSNDQITNTFDVPVVKISNIYFSGLHPDLCYIGGLGKRIEGPLIDYHSKISLYGFLNGLSIDNTLSLFKEQIYSKAGFIDEYEASLAELKNRDLVADVAVTTILPKLLKERLCFFSVNHPSPALFSCYAESILSYLTNAGFGDMSGLPADSNYSTESLASNCIYPIYPEIAAWHGIERLGSYSFKAPGSRINPINLRKFLEGEFKCFSSVGAADLAKTYTGQRVLDQLSFLKG